MRITHFKNLVDYNRNLEGLSCQREELLDAAVRRSAPELLSFLPDVEVEKMTLNNIELCTHILYANFRRLLRFPSLGMIDQKQKYCSIYTSNRNLKPFFNGQSIKTINYRTVAEIMLLYGLSGQDIQMMDRWCCEFEREDGDTELDYGLLKSIYTKKQLAHIIKSCLDGKTSYFLPDKITKGQEYLSFADFLHTFRAIEMNPYEVLEMFVHKKTNFLAGLNAAISVYGTFKTEPLDMPADSSPTPAPLGVSSISVPNLGATSPVMPIHTPPQAPASSVAAPVSSTHARQAVSQQEAPNIEFESRNGVVKNESEVAGEKSKLQAADQAKQTQIQEPPKIIGTHSDNLTFGNIMKNALGPLRRNKEVFIPKNIYVLRDGVEGHRGGQDRDFDKLFAHSSTTNLDVFNYLVRTSYIYAVPMYDLLFTDIKYGQYTPQKLFWTKEYSLTGIASELCRPPIKDENLFRILSTYPPQKLNIFDYKTSEAQRPPQPMVKAPAATPVNAKTPVSVEFLVSESNGTTPTLLEKLVPTPTSPPTPTHTTKEVSKMNIELKMRLCQPCDADSWENDNPDRSAPGFHWETANPDVCNVAKEAVGELVKTSCFDPMVIRAGIAAAVNLPFKAQVVITASGYRASYDLY